MSAVAQYQFGTSKKLVSSRFVKPIRLKWSIAVPIEIVATNKLPVNKLIKGPVPVDQFLFRFSNMNLITRKMTERNQVTNTALTNVDRIVSKSNEPRVARKPVPPHRARSSSTTDWLTKNSSKLDNSNKIALQPQTLATANRKPRPEPGMNSDFTDLEKNVLGNDRRIRRESSDDSPIIKKPMINQ